MIRPLAPRVDLLILNITDELLDRVGRDQQQNMFEVIEGCVKIFFIIPILRGLDHLRICHSFKPAMVHGGISPERVDELSTDAQNEIFDTSRHVFWRYHFVYGIRLKIQQ